MHASDEDHFARRIQAHLTINDFSSAREEADYALSLYPQSLLLHESRIRTLAKIGDEKAMLDAWNIYVQVFPNKSMNRELIEDMAWGVLSKASNSSSLIMREMSLLAAYFSQDAKGIEILFQAMKDSNYAIRATAVKLAGHCRDHKLVEEVKRLFLQERTWTVRQNVLAAIGQMKIKSMRTDLEALIASKESPAGEKALAMASLLELMDSINRVEIERLASSNRAGLRQLVCKAIAYFQSNRDLDQLLRMTEDSNPDVRIEAFQAIGKLRPSQQTDTIISIARKGITHSHAQVALSAAWVLILYVPDEGDKVFEHFLNDERREVRILASAALSATGKYGSTLALKHFRFHYDPFVRLNLAMGLIGQRLATQEAATFIRQMLENDKSKWQSFEIGHFEAIVNYPIQRSTDSLENPEVENQLLRLELFNLLAIVKEPGTQEAIRNYLMERSWGISATAAALLLTEGDESAIELVQHLLDDAQPKVRLQAALILSLWSRDEHAIQALEDAFGTCEWDMKARILEGLGRIGSMRSVPFLIQVLKEPSQSLRLIAAMAIIQCLNH